MIKEKLPPQAIDFEKAVLGAVMLEKTAFERASAILKDYHFFDENHSLIYRCMAELAAQNSPVDILTVPHQVRKSGISPDEPWEYRIAMLTSVVSSTANLEFHAGIIFQTYILRELISAGSLMIQESYESDADPWAIQEKVITKLDSLTLTHGREVVSLLDAFKNRVKEIETIQAKGLTVTGIDTGSRKLNEILYGWQKGDLVIIAARPGQGKSAMAANLAMNVARQKIPVVIFSLEMSIAQLIDRIMSAEAHIEGKYFKRADMSKAEWEQLMATNFDLPLFIDDTPSQSIQSLKTKIRKYARKHGIKMAYVDYLQLAQAREKGDNREQEISKISRGLKLIAKEVGIPVVALAQLSRDAEKRNGPPILADLRESGSIEQDADIVIFPYDQNSHDKTMTKVILDVIIAKHRNGSVGIKTMLFDKTVQKITDYNESKI